jgi:hypothetical protein
LYFCKIAIPVSANISVIEYLEREIQFMGKLEYFEGQIFAMSGASIAHNRLLKCDY